MKTLNLFLVFWLFFAQAAFGLTDTDKAILNSENVLLNPGFESGLGKWTASGGTLSHVTSGSNFLKGKGSATWDSNGAGQTLSTSPYVIEKGNFGKNGVFSCDVQTPSGVATHLMEIYDGTNVIGTSTINSSVTSKESYSTFVFPSSGSITARFKSVNADEPLIAIDNCTVKPTSSSAGIVIDSISDPIDGGQITFGGTTSAPTKPTTRITDKVRYALVGKYLVAEYDFSYTSNSGAGPGSGDYLYSLPAGFSFDSNLVTYFTTAGATLAASGLSASALDTSGWITANGSAAGPVVAYAYDATRFRIGISQIFTASGLQSSSFFRINDTSVQLKFTIKVPIAGRSSSQSAAAASQTDYGWTPYTPTLTSLNATSISFRHRRVSDLLEVDGTFTSGTTASALGSISLPSNCVGLDTSVITLANTTANPGQKVGDYQSSVGHGKLVTATGTSTSLIYFAGNQTSSAFLTPNSNTSANVIGNSLPVSVNFKVPCSNFQPNQRSPTHTGSVTSNAVGAERFERAKVADSCSASPCTIFSQSGSWLTSVTRSGNGTYAINYPASTFSSAPTCHVTPISAAQNAFVRYVSAPSTTSASIQVLNNSGGAGLDSGLEITCIGPR